MTNTAQWNKAEQAVQAANTILIVGHVAPDGDAIGSMLGLAHWLKNRGKIITTAVDEGVPDYLEFLPGAEDILAKLESGSWDLMISTDSSDESRTGEAGQYGRANSQTVINLDHHRTNTQFGDVLLVIPEAVSATEIVFDWIEASQSQLDLDTAEALLTGLVTDTIGFRVSSVSPRTLEIAQKLMAVGASLPRIMARTLESKPFSHIDLWKYALQSVILEDQVVSANITRDFVTQAGLTETTDGGLVSLLNTVNEAVVAVVFKETLEGRVEISLRSKPGYDVAAIAFSLGGGGHKQAAGATIDGPLEDARERVLPMVHEAAQNGSPVLL